MATWKFDSLHSQADFSARHLMVTVVRGTFRSVAGTLEFDPANPAAASVEATIETSSMTSTGMDQRDQHLKSPDFLHIENYPNITFKSTKVEAGTDGTTAKVTGDLTIKDVTKSVVLNVEYLGMSKNPMSGNDHIGFTATTKINREDFGLTWNMPLEAGGWLVGKEITITLDIAAETVKEAVLA